MTRRRGKIGAAGAPASTDGGGGRSHYDKGFEIAAYLEEEQKKLNRATSSAARTLHRRNLRDKGRQLKDLADRDKRMTRVLAKFLRRDDTLLDARSVMIKWMRGGYDELGTYAAFLKWCVGERERLHRLGERRQLTPAEARFVSDLDEINELDERTIRHRLHDQYSACRPKKTSNRNGLS